MRLAILHHTYGRFGGAERLTLEHFIELKRMGVDVELFYNGIIPLFWRERLSDLEVANPPCGLPRSLTDLKDVVGYLKILKGFDKIIIHHHIEPTLAFYIAKYLGSKVFWYCGEPFTVAWAEVFTDVDYRKFSPNLRVTSNEFYGIPLTNITLSNVLYPLFVRMLRAVDISTVRRFRKIIANSNFTASLVTKIYKLKRVPSVVYPGVNINFAKHANPHGRMRQYEPYALIVGSWIPQKNIEGAIRASSMLTPPLKIVLAGNGSEETRQKLELVAKGFEVPVEFLRNPDDETLAQLYGGCEFLLNVSIYEPFGLTPAEAALFHKPSIVTKNGGMDEVVVNGETGFIVAPLNHAEIAEKMKILFNDKSISKEMGLRAHRRVVELFTLKRSTKRLWEEVEDS